jgi:hypothetical protein
MPFNGCIAALIPSKWLLTLQDDPVFLAMHRKLSAEAEKTGKEPIAT